MKGAEKTVEHDWAEFEETYLGTIDIAPEVIEIIGGFAALEVEGVAAMTGGVVGDLTEKLGRKNLRRGVKVEIGPQEVGLSVSVSVQHGVSIPRVANDIQHNVKNAVEAMTALTVKQVDVLVTGVQWAGKA